MQENTVLGAGLLKLVYLLGTCLLNVLCLWKAKRFMFAYYIDFASLQVDVATSVKCSFGALFGNFGLPVNLYLSKHSIE